MGPGRSQNPTQPTAIGSALLLVGDQWNLLILRQAFLSHTRRFADWRDAIGVADSVLSRRITELVAAEVLTPVPYRAGGRTRTEYLLTAKALPLWAFLVAIWSWEQTWSDADTGPAQLEHLQCGRYTVPEMGCVACSQAPVTARDTSVMAGPDTTFRNVSVPRHHRRTVRDRNRSAADAYLPQTLEILGDRWSTVVLVAAFLRARRFGDFQQALGIAPGVLSDRLGRFTELGIFAQVRTAEHDEYRLTDKGLGFFPVFAFLVNWAQTWYPSTGDGGLTITHEACGRPLVPFLRCTGCGRPMHRVDLRFVVAPVDAHPPSADAGPADTGPAVGAAQVPDRQASDYQA